MSFEVAFKIRYKRAQKEQLTFRLDCLPSLEIKGEGRCVALWDTYSTACIVKEVAPPANVHVLYNAKILTVC